MSLDHHDLAQSNYCSEKLYFDKNESKPGNTFKRNESMHQSIDDKLQAFNQGFKLSEIGGQQSPSSKASLLPIVN